MRITRFWLWLTVAMAACGALAAIPVSAQGATGGDLCLYGDDATLDTGDPMMAGTDPSIAIEPNGGGSQVAFQNASQQLAFYYDASGSTTSTGLGMDPRSSPSVADADGYATVAFAANTDQLETIAQGTPSDTGQYLESGTSPAAAVTSSSGAEYAYENTNSDLFAGDGSSWVQVGIGITPGTSPSIAAPDGSWETANQANTTTMWLAGTVLDSNTGDAMASGTSAGIGALAQGAYFEAAWQSTGNTLYLLQTDDDNGGSPVNTGKAMAPGTNPAVTGTGSGLGYEVAYQGANGDLWIDGSDGTMDTGHPMASGTSPAITATDAGYEVAYQCAAAAVPATTETVTTVLQTTTVAATTPVPTSTDPTSTQHHPGARPKLQAKFTLDLTWNGRTTHLRKVRSLKRLPRSARLTFACRAETRGDPCPRLGTPPRREPTLHRQLAVVADRTFPQNNLLTLDVSAPGYVTEVFSIHLTGSHPKITQRWK